MNKKIVIMLHLFDKQQQCFVLENNVRLETIFVDMDSLIDNIFMLSEKYLTFDVMLIGPKQYARGLVKKIEKEEIKRYNHNSLNITIPERIKK